MTDSRRPLKVRSSRWAIKFAKYLAGKSITPNEISLMSMVFAFVAMLGAMLWNVFSPQGVKVLFLAFIIIGVQGRLLCNLFDGMVALEGGKKTPAGELYNDIPDRVSDTLIFLGLGIGLGIGLHSMPFALGWSLFAALFAALTAYIRLLGSSMGAPAFFSGPMAKQHRMAAITIATLIAIGGTFFPDYPVPEYVLYLALLIIAVGSVATCVNRTLKIKAHMESQAHGLS